MKQTWFTFYCHSLNTILNHSTVLSNSVKTVKRINKKCKGIRLSLSKTSLLILILHISKPLQPNNFILFPFDSYSLQFPFPCRSAIFKHFIIQEWGIMCFRIDPYLFKYLNSVSFNPEILVYQESLCDKESCYATTALSVQSFTA